MKYQLNLTVNIGSFCNEDGGEWRGAQKSEAKQEQRAYLPTVRLTAKLID